VALSFADIVGGGTYLLQMFVTNNVPPGLGSIALGLEGSTATFSSSVPEPASLALVGLALAGLAATRRRGRA
jgi:hypothetical protein